MSTALASVSQFTGSAGGGRQRRRLQSVPASAGPVVPLESGNPLQLSKSMRTRLLAAVRALVAAPALARASDGARLASVVLAAKAKVSDDYATSTWAAELGRWLGVSQSTVAHTVLPELRRAGVLGSKVATNAFGHATGLDCWVVPMYRAQKAGDRRHPLALSRSELAVLLRLLEVLFGPGWEPKGREPVPAGMLAGRTGRGAATDRLGLLLMTLSTNSRGWLQLCAGSVDTSRGRPAATVARLLGCSPGGAAKVLERLEGRGVVGVVRQETCSGLKGKSRVRLVAVAEAHGHAVREAREGLGSTFSDLAATASGDLGVAESAETPVTTSVSRASEQKFAGVADLSAAAHHHASHASVVSPGRSASVSGGFSGEGRGGFGDRPERAGAREDQAGDAPATDEPRVVVGDGDPLRGEQPEKSPSMSSSCSKPVAGGPLHSRVGAGQDRQQWGRVPAPPEDLQAVLEPVRLVWSRLERPAARRLVEAAARTELVKVAGLSGRHDAQEVLADRIARRLGEQLRLGAPIASPVGWLVSRALPQRQECGDQRCDEGVLLDSGRECVRCEDLRVDSRARRRAVAAAVDAEMPSASPEERRAATERQLHESVTARAWARELEWEQVRARQAAATKAGSEAAAARLAIDEPTVPEALVEAPAPRLVAIAPEPATDAVDQELVLEDLTREEVLDWRYRAARDHQIVHDHIDRYGEVSAKRLFTGAFVDQVTRLSRLGHLNLGYTTWGTS
ncbi:hypothetical protein AB0919_23205 [Streptomyces sp. NPDC046994]|uniref:hypothetical protein n=1 Tax=Streptomyces sp. NPDC046994 TaxID=3155735 RepID=UPI0034518340